MERPTCPKCFNKTWFVKCPNCGFEDGEGLNQVENLVSLRKPLQDIQAALTFINTLSKIELAEFIVKQNEAIAGLTKNNESFRKTVKD